MHQTTYSRFDNTELILRDELAIDRTLLSNERTLLAYLRSGVALFIGGLSIMQFSSTTMFRLVGVACIPFGIFATIFGLARYHRMNRRIALVRKKAKKTYAEIKN